MADADFRGFGDVSQFPESLSGDFFADFRYCFPDDLIPDEPEGVFCIGFKIFCEIRQIRIAYRISYF